MTIPDQLILSEILSSHVFCDEGIDHGIGVLAWMHPPVHRLLGWSTKPSSLSLERHIWRLNQIKGFSNKKIYVKGLPALSDQVTINRLPTLLDTDLLNKSFEKLGSIVDLVFDPKTGKIIYYLVARTDPRIPGTSRWRLKIDSITDQQPGKVTSNIDNLDDLPLIYSSVRQGLIRKSRRLRDQLTEISSNASNRLEGWLDENPFEEQFQRISRLNDAHPSSNRTDDWVDESDSPNNFYRESINNTSLSNDYVSNASDDEDDPWI